MCLDRGRPANCCLILYLGQPVTYFLLGCGKSKQKVQKTKSALTLCVDLEGRLCRMSWGQRLSFLATPCPRAKTQTEFKCHLREMWWYYCKATKKLLFFFFFIRRLLVKEYNKCQDKGNTEQSLECLRVSNDNVGTGCFSAELNWLLISSTFKVLKLIMELFCAADISFYAIGIAANQPFWGYMLQSMTCRPPCLMCSKMKKDKMCGLP